MTKLLTRRLATLLEEMDSEYTTTPNYETVHKERDKAIKNEDVVQNNGEETDLSIKNEVPVHSNGESSDLLRLTVHNILLDGVVNHVDFSEIYKEIQAFQRAFKEMYPRVEWKTRRGKNIESWLIRKYSILQIIEKISTSTTT